MRPSDILQLYHPSDMDEYRHPTQMPAMIVSLNFAQHNAFASNVM
jgi:hypothetical protein